MTPTLSPGCEPGQQRIPIDFAPLDAEIAASLPPVLAERFALMSRWEAAKKRLHQAEVLDPAAAAAAAWDVLTAEADVFEHEGDAGDAFLFGLRAARRHHPERLDEQLVRVPLVRLLAEQLLALHERCDDHAGRLADLERVVAALAVGV
jgi:hypothetical protein